MFFALAFIQPNDIIRYFELLLDEIHNNFNDDFEDLMDYFEDGYIDITFRMILRTRVLGEPANYAPSSFFLQPLLYKLKIILLEIIKFLLYLLSRSIRNVFFILQEKLKCKLFLWCQPWWCLP